MLHKDVEIVIIEFIRANTGCMPEEAYKGVSKHMSRQKFFNELKKLKKDKIVLSRNRNNRDKSLFLNNEDPIVIVGNNLDKFEYTYFKFFNTASQEMKKPHSSIKQRVKDIEREKNIITLPPDHFELFNSVIFVFQKSITSYLLEVLLKWGPMISDKEYRAKIFEFALGRISELYLKLFKHIETISIENDLKISLNPNTSKTLLNLVIQDISNLGHDRDAVTDNLLDIFQFFKLEEELFKIPNFSEWLYPK